jgi:ketosteroid isomerase-like protein
MATKAAADVAKIIKANNKALGAEVAAGNAAAIGKMYAKGAMLMPTGAGILKGKDIAGFWQGAINAGIKGATLKSKEVEVLGGSTAVEVGTYVLTGEGGAVADEGKYIVVWKKDGKAWKLYRDIFNSSRPAG